MSGVPTDAVKDSWGLADLASKPDRVRFLLMDVPDLSTRGLQTISAMLHFLDWQRWCMPLTEDDPHPETSASAAAVGRVLRVSSRTIRRAWNDLKVLGLLTRKPRAWMPNYFRLEVDKLIELSREGRRRARARLAARIQDWPEPPAPTRPPAEAGAVEAGPGARAWTWDPRLDAELVKLPEDLADDIRAALVRGGRAAEGALPSWASTGIDRKAGHALGFTRLLCAVRAFARGAETPDELRRHAGHWGTRIAALWRASDYCPPELLAADLMLVALLRGGNFYKSLRPRDWSAHRAEAWHRFMRPPDVLEDLGDSAAGWPAVEDIQPEGPEQDPAGAQLAPAAPAQVSAFRRVVEALRGRLHALPELPDLSDRPSIDPERRAVTRERLHRAELSEQLDQAEQLLEGEPAGARLAEQLARMRAAEAALSPRD